MYCKRCIAGCKSRHAKAQECHHWRVQCHWVLPSNRPAGHSSHSIAACPLIVPGGQLEQPVDVLRKRPGWQSMHIEDPTVLHWPSWQSEHVSFGCSENVPSGQSVQKAEAGGLYWPLWQGIQEVASTPLNVPCGHSSQLEAGSVMYLPGRQDLHAVAAIPLNRPAGQRSHVWSGLRMSQMDIRCNFPLRPHWTFQQGKLRTSLSWCHW